jgi:hypothetical protein
VKLVEQHIRKSDPRFVAIDGAAFASKNLYNQANYQIRQAFIHEGKYLPYNEAYKEDPAKFVGRPKLPKYKEKEKGRNILIYDMQALLKKALKRGLIAPSGLGIEIPTKQTRKTIDQVRIVPCLDGYLDRMTTKRTRRVNAYLHTASRRIIDHLVREGIGTLCVGKNPLWKQEVEMGRKNTQQLCPDDLPSKRE